MLASTLFNAERVVSAFIDGEWVLPPHVSVQDMLVGAATQPVTGAGVVLTGGLATGQPVAEQQQ